MKKNIKRWNMQQEDANNAMFAAIKSNDFLAVSQALAAGAGCRG